MRSRVDRRNIQRNGGIMDRFAVLPASEKTPYFDTMADRLGILPEMVEKDFWVCWTLEKLFSLKNIGARITFKGGTSLSKCYNAIERFSEDVDIAIERKFLARPDKPERRAGEHGKDIEPSVDVSNKENQRRIEELMASARAAIRKQFLPELRRQVEKILGKSDQWSIDLDPKDPLEQTLLFVFPKAAIKTDREYVMPIVKIELGARSDDWPAQSVQVSPYVADILRDALAVQPITVKVLSAERTFWEKAMILHRLYHSPEDKAVSKRMSRHYYDLCAMNKAGIFEKALKDVKLMQSVVEFNRLFFRYSWLNYDEAKRGSFRLIPKDAERIKSLKADYRQMEQMFFKDQPAFDEIVTALKKMEDRINQ